MYYRLIIRKTNTSIEELGIEKIDYEFGKLYKLNNVAIIGDWFDCDDPNVTYTITAYRNENHYLDFIDKMKQERTYQEYSNYLSQYTTSIIHKKLELSPMMKYNFDELIMQKYLRDVTNKLQEFKR